MCVCSVTIDNVVPLSGLDLRENLQTLLRDALHFSTAQVGKWHLAADNTGRSDYSSLQAQVRSAGFTHAEHIYFSNLAQDYDQQMEWMIADAITFLNTSLRADASFFLHLNPVLPGGPGMPDVLSNDPPTNVRLQSGLARNLPSAARSILPSRSSVLARATNSPTEQKALSEAAAMIWLDDGMGAIVSLLEARRVLDETFIVITADHAYEAKGEAYELGIRVPFIVRYPGAFPAGTTHRGLVSTLDLVPTVTELAGYSDPADGSSQPPWARDGMSLVTLMNDASARDHLMIEIFNDRAVVFDDFKYVYKPQGDRLANTVSGSLGK